MNHSEVPLYLQRLNAPRTQSEREHRQLAILLSNVSLVLGLAWIAAAGKFGGRCQAEEIQVRTNYHALVLYYNPHVRIDGEYRTVRQAYNYRDIDALCDDYITFLKRASGGQVNFSVVDRFELDEFPPDNDPNVTFTPENFDEYKRQGYDIFNTSKADYLTICSDPRFNIVPRVEAGEVDAVWIFGPDYTGFWETSMAGKDSYWINGGAYPEVKCSKRFVIYGFGMASHQGVGFMLENTAHMTENILGGRIMSGWPASHEVTGWNTMNLNNSARTRVTRRLNDWEFFTVSDSVHWDTKLTAPGQSQAGLSHFPPTAYVNYGWAPVRIEFDASWHAEHFQTFGGAWQLEGGDYSVSGEGNSKAILYGSHDMDDSEGKYRVPVIVTDADIEVGLSIAAGSASAHAGLLLRASRYSDGTNRVNAYYVGLNPDDDRVELARINNGTYEVLAQKITRIDAGVVIRLHVSLSGPVIRVALTPSAPPVLNFTNATDLVDGAVGLSSYGAGASFSHLYVTPSIANHAESWRTYPNLSANTRTLSPLEWEGDGRPYNDHDYWFAWWYEHLPKNPGTHEIRDPSTGAVLGKALNSWWPYVFDINRFDRPFLGDATIVSAPADSTPPAAPTNFRGIAEGAREVRLEWDEPADNVGVTRYEVYRNGHLLRETALRYFTETSLAPNTKYFYTIKARDGSGNVSAASSEVTVKTASTDQALLNGDFETGLSWPVRWKTEAFKSSAVFDWNARGTGRNATGAISISAGEDPNDARWVQEIDGLIPNGRYLLRGWIKGQDIVLDTGATVGANLCVMGGWDHTSPQLSGTFDWCEVQMHVWSDSTGRLVVGCRLGFWGSLASGTAWFDDLTLEYAPLDPPPVVGWGLDMGGLGNYPEGLGNAVALAAGSSHNVALTSDANVLAWGANWSGQTDVPPGLNDVIAVAAASSHSLALRADGTVVGWGDNIYGQCVSPPGLTNAIAISTGSRFSVALRADGTVVGWGGNDWGELDVPAGLSDVVALQAGHEFCLALKANGTVAVWGSFQGPEDLVYPAYVPEGLDQVVGVACGNYHGLALRSDGTVVAWGENESGQTNVPPDLNQVIAIAAGANHSMALKANGTVVTWGGNNHGQLEVPPTLAHAFAISASTFRSVALIGTKPPSCTVRPSRLAFDSETFRADFASQIGQPYFLQGSQVVEGAAWTLICGMAARARTSTLTDVSATGSRCYYFVRTTPHK